MLLVEPPADRDEWVRLKTHDSRFPCLLGQYCNDYISAVMSLPPDQIAKVIDYLCREVSDCDVDPDSFHLIVQRELAERDFEPSGKIARIVIVCALGETLSDRGVAVDDETELMLDRCWELIPAVLILAVDDHFGLLSAACC